MLAKGFSLVELMVVVAIIGIIAAVAYPSYTNYISDTYRAQALADMQICALEMERWYPNSFTYVGGDARCTLWSPADRPQADSQYTLSFPGASNPSQNDFTIRATPASGSCPCIELSADGTQTNIP